MLQLVDERNEEILPEMLDRDAPATPVQCVTCHHGLNKPQTLQMVLWDAIETEGPDAAVDLYAELREDYFGLGAYDFGEWEMNELARKLGAVGIADAAIAMLLVNEEHHPESPSIQYMLGELYEKTGDREAAMARYERTLEILPEHRGAKARLEALQGG
jgi:tetratricopeptide (TPR) repeat protein